MKKRLLSLLLMILSMSLLLTACKVSQKETFNFGSNEYGNYLIYENEKDGKFASTRVESMEQEAEDHITTPFSSVSPQKN